MRSIVPTYRVGLILALAGLLAACGSSSNTTTSSGSSPAAEVSVAVSPSTTAVAAGGSTQFAATVTGTANTAVTWSVSGAVGTSAGLGTISSTGLYTAPAGPSSEVVMVTATSAAAATTSGSGTVTVLNPGQVVATQNAQVAQYSFSAPRTGTVTIQFGTTTSYGLETSAQPIPAGGGAVNVLVAGMQAYATYHMRASVQFPDGAQYLDSDHTFTTTGLPAARLPNIIITVPPGPATNPGIEMFNLAASPTNQIQAAVTDLQGNVIWYYDFDNIGSSLPFPMKPLANGHIKIAIGTVYPYTIAPLNVVNEIDLAGNTISQLTLPQLNAGLVAAGSSIVAMGFHHDFCLLPNGHTVYIVYDIRDVTLTGETTPTLVIGDALVDVDPDGAVTWTWSAFDHLDINYHPFGFPDWTHSNALIYSLDDGNLILSSRSLSWVMKINYSNGAGNGDVIWKLGPGGDFTLTNGGPSDWFYNQHYPYLTSPVSVGSYPLAVYDDGNSRPDPTNGLPCGTAGAIACYSRGVILNVNEPALTASIAWQDNLSPLFGQCCGNISNLANTDVEIGAGATALAYPQATETLEVTQTATPEVVWQMNITGQFAYRAFRIPSLYPGVIW